MADAKSPQDKPPQDLEAYLELKRREIGLRTIADLAKLAGVPPSSISMAMKGERPLSSKNVVLLAKALDRTGEGLRQILQELIDCGPSRNQSVGDLIDTGGTLADKIRGRGKIRALTIPNPPFVEYRGGNGLALDFFDVQCRSLHLEPEFKRGQFAQMREELRADCEIIVTAVLPNPRRGLYMDYTRPLPYLQIPLSGIYDTRHWKGPLFVTRLFDRNATMDAELLTVAGEVGHDFAYAYLDPTVISRSKSVDTMDIRTIADQLLRGLGNLFLADVATCQDVMRALDAAGKNPFEAIAEDDETLVRPLYTSKSQSVFAQIASYPVVFGYRKGETDLCRMLDEALTYALTEGIRRVISIYSDYMTRYPEFYDWYFRFDESDTSVPIVARKFFRNANDVWAKSRVQEDTR